MLSMLALFAVGAVASASASAAECPDTVKGKDVAICKTTGGVKKEVEGTFTFTSKKKAGTTSELKVENGPDIVCTAAENTGKIVATNSSLKITHLVITFTICKVVNTPETEAECKVTEPIVANGGGTEGIEGNWLEEKTSPITFKPAVGTTFAEVTITGVGCIFKVAKAKVVGEQECNLVTPETEALNHVIECTFAGSKLKFGAALNKAEFKLTEEAALSGTEAGKEYGFYES
jgi:hypothetical protein